MKHIILAIVLALIWATPVHAGIPVQPSFAPLVKKTAPAVVNIYTKRVVQERVSPFANDPFFSQFFNAPQFGGMVRQRIASALGSGVIVAADGVIVTNNHVIKDSTEINVVTSDGREYPAKKLLADARTDLAVLKIDTKGEKLPVLAFTDSDAVEVGDIVLAIGNPFGVGQTVTSGIVSGLARTEVGVSDYSFFIQTDAAINPGNSGGALINTDGELIGINSAIFSKDGGSLGIGFAIPANMVKAILDAALHGDKVVRPWTGVTGQPVTPDMFESLGLKHAGGALANRVRAGSPADRAGIKPGDVILSINGHDVQDPSALKFRLATVAIGSDINLSVWRKGKQIDVKMKAEAPPEDPPREETLIQGNNPLSGAVVANLSPALIEDLNQLPADSGVVVLGTKGGNAARIGLQAGDLVLAANGNKIASVKELTRVMAAGGAMVMQIGRGEKTITLRFTP